MSEYRKPAEIWTKRLPETPGKKPCRKMTKLELFPAHYWAENWEPGSALFFPKLPLQSEARNNFWESNFRVRKDGAWIGKKAKYEFFTKVQIFNFYFFDN